MAEIKSIYAPQVEADLKKVYKELEKHHKLIIEMSKTSIDFYGGRQAGNPNELKNAIKAYEELNKKQKVLTDNIKKLEEKQKALLIAQRNLSNQSLNDAKIQSALNREQITAINLSERKRKADEAQKASAEKLAQAEERKKAKITALSSAYMQLSKAEAESARRVQDLVARGKLATQTTAQYSTELRKAQTEHEKLKARVVSADQAVGRFNRNVGNYKSAFSGMAGGLRSLMGAFGVAGGLFLFAQITTDTIRLIKELQSLNLALEQVSGTQADFTSNLSFIQKTSENLGLSINDLTQQFTQFYVSAKDKLARQEIEQIFTSIAKAGATMGLSLEQQNRAFLAINQMMSKGTVQAEELRGQLGEALPGAFTIMAKAIGVTEKELGNMLKKGEVLAKDVLPAFAKELEKAYGIENITNVKTLTAETNRLGNAWTNFVKSVDSGNGVISKALNFMLSSLTDIIKLVNRVTDSEARKNTNIEKGFETEKKYQENFINNRKKQLEFTGKTEKGITQTIENENKERLKNSIKASEDEINLLKTKNHQLKNQEKNIQGGVIGKAINFFTTGSGQEIKANQKRIEELTGAIKFANSQLNKKIETNKKDTTETIKNTTATKDNAKAKEKTMELLKGTEAWYNDLLRQLKEEQSTLVDSTTQYKIYSDAIAEVEKQLDRLKNGIKGVEIQPLKMPKEEGNELEERLKAETDAIIEQNQAQERAIELMRQRADEILNSFGMDFINNSGLTTFFDLVENGLGQFGDNWQAKTAAIMEATQEMFNFISNLSHAHFEQEYSDLERQKEISIQFAGDSTVAREEIEKEYERRRKEIQIREAKAKRSQAMFNIGIDMAQGIMRAWAQNPLTAPVMTAIIGALGVAQIAAVASQPLPQFWKGTDNAPEGFAEVGERGRELIKDGKSGQWRLAEKRSVDYLTKGSTVLTNANTEKVLNFHAFNKGLTNTLVENNIDFYPIESKIDKLTNAILNKESLRIVEDSNGRKYYTEKNGQVRGLNNARLMVKQSVF